VKSCYFHLKQSIWRKIQELGFQVRYGTQLNFAHTLKWCAAVTFVPLDQV
jgi:hypothetical protein